MRKKIILITMVLLAFVIASGQTETKRYAVITNPMGAVVRANVEVGSGTVGARNAPQGQRLEVLAESELWAFVKTSSGEGYISLTDCKLVDAPLKGGFPVGPVVLLIVLFGAVGGAVYFFNTKKGLIEKEDNIL
jgi:hypothetical protein